MGLDIALTRLYLPHAILLQNLTLNVPSGVIHTVMGASGSGKSSLLAALCGTLTEPLAFEGAIWLNGQRIDALPTERRQVGILFQEDLLFAHMTVAENLLFAVPSGPRPVRQASVMQGLQDLEMSDFANANPATLSGGQRAQPQALLLDEPFSKLDEVLRQRLREFVFALVKQRHIPVLLVTHDRADIADPNHLTTL